MNLIHSFTAVTFSMNVCCLWQTHSSVKAVIFREFLAVVFICKDFLGTEYDWVSPCQFTNEDKYAENRTILHRLVCIMMLVHFITWIQSVLLVSIDIILGYNIGIEPMISVWILENLPMNFREFEHVAKSLLKFCFCTSGKGSRLFS